MSKALLALAGIGAVALIAVASRESEAAPIQEPGTPPTPAPTTGEVVIDPSPEGWEPGTTIVRGKSGQQYLLHPYLDIDTPEGPAKVVGVTLIPSLKGVLDYAQLTTGVRFLVTSTGDFLPPTDPRWLTAMSDLGIFGSEGL